MALTGSDDARRVQTKLAEIVAARARVQRLVAATVAFVPVGQVNAEKTFNQQGEDTSIVRPDGRPGRRGSKWFSYDVAVDGSQPMALVVTYNSDNRRARTFEILVDGRHVAEQSVDKSSVSRSRSSHCKDLHANRGGAQMNFVP